MSRKEQLISKGLEIADTGIFRKENINAIIKADFLNQYHHAINLTRLYSKLSKKYGIGLRTIMKICNH